MRIDTQSKVFVFRSVIEDERAPGAAASEVAPSPSMAAAMAWSTPLPLVRTQGLVAPSTATSIRPLPLSDLRLLTAYASEPPQLRDASSVPPPPAPAPAPTQASAFAKAAKSARSTNARGAPAATATSHVRPTARTPATRVSSFVHAVTLAAPYAAALLVFGVAQAKWASDAWTGMREHDALTLFSTRAPRPAPVIAPVVAPPSSPLPQPAMIAVEDVAPELDTPSEDAVSSAKAARAPRGGTRTPPARATVIPGSAPRGSR